MSPKSNPTPESLRFHTILHQAEGMNATGVIVPDEILARLGKGKRPPVRISIIGYEYRSTVGIMGGKAMVGVSAAIRKETGLAGGDEIDVEISLDETPRQVDLPDDFRAALDAHPGTRTFFDNLSNSLQRYHNDTINAAKTDETRQRRIDKAIALFQAGKKR